MFGSPRFHLAWALAVVMLGACASPPPATSPASTAATQPAGVVSPAQSPGVGQPAAPSAAPGPARQNVTFKSGDLTLAGYIYKPDGPGPFPAIVWNHGSDKDPAQGSGFDALAQIFVPAGYVVFFPIRRGQGTSQGTSLQDQVQQEQTSKGAAAAQQLFAQQMAGPQLDDQLAGLAYLKGQPYVDGARLAVAGCSDGGIQAVLGAEKGGYQAAVAISPAADSWDGNASLQQALTKAVSSISAPVFLIHPEKDTSVAPGYALAQDFLKLGKPYSLKIYPPFGPAAEQGICFGGAQGYHWWAADVLSFLDKAFTPPAAAKVPAPIKAQQITLKSDGLNLVGYLYKPQGPGPFPGIIWNHGSEQNPTAPGEFSRIASLFVPAGYVVVDPVRRGQGGSEGTYIADATKSVVQSKGRDVANEFLVQQMEGPQLDDQLSGLAYLQGLPYVDKNRLAVVGCSYGGIQTLMGAASGAGYKAAVALSPAAESWQGNPLLQQALIKKVSEINIPTFIIHPAQDASLAPGYALGPQFQQLGKPYGLEIFPPFGPEVQHCFGGGPDIGTSIWGPAALTFLSNVLH